eukprot:CAMPEP_0117439382 /NCGR_PEP_ID=MMETSP0759-20121206/2537_1 /TAXON_ID=63605 /ORGANISM="Percolomonas cosmopolitus, Strain WS" /LENGTH=794 /DNA_ID=CAMNT_0005231097 /DNA_START=165 /DNA_END=2549 /DNA_ORIENTATION=+
MTSTSNMVETPEEAFHKPIRNQSTSTFNTTDAIFDENSQSGFEERKKNEQEDALISKESGLGQREHNSLISETHAEVQSRHKGHHLGKRIPVPRLCHSLAYMSPNHLILANGIGGMRGMHQSSEDPTVMESQRHLVSIRPAPLNDLWKFDLESKKWRALFDYSSSDEFQVRARRSKVFEETESSRGQHDAVHSYNPSIWSSGKFGCTSFFDERQRKFYVFGGALCLSDRLEEFEEKMGGTITLDQLIGFHLYSSGRSEKTKNHESSAVTPLVQAASDVAQAHRTTDSISPALSSLSPPVQFQTDLFVYDLEKKYWRKVKRMPGANVVWPRSSCFGAAQVHSVPLVTDSNASSEDEPESQPNGGLSPSLRSSKPCAFLFGGYPIVSDTNLYRYSFERQQWTIQPSTNGHLVPGRWSHQMICSNRSLFIIFGRDKHTCLNDMYEYSFARETWYKVEPVAGSFIPEGRYGHSAVLSKRHSIFVFGGILTSGRKSNELLEFSLKRQKWRRVKLMHILHARAFHTAIITDSQHMILYGGVRDNAEVLVTGIDEIFIGRKKRPKRVLSTNQVKDNQQKTQKKRKRKIPIRTKRAPIAPDSRVYNYQLPLKKDAKGLPIPSPIYRLVTEGDEQEVVPHLPKLSSSNENGVPGEGGSGSRSAALSTNNSVTRLPKSRSISPTSMSKRGHSRSVSPDHSSSHFKMIIGASSQHLDDLLVVSHRNSMNNVQLHSSISAMSSKERQISDSSHHPALRNAQAQSDALQKYVNKENAHTAASRVEAKNSSFQSRLPRILRNHHTAFY